MSDQSKYSAGWWLNELSRYKEDYREFIEAGEKVVKRYRDERKHTENTNARFNILYSNTRTLKPAVYSKPPQPEVSRRFKDQNPVARVASMILERALDYEITQFTDYHSSMSQAVDDLLLPGRGVAWIRYEPITEEVQSPLLTEDRTDEQEYYESGDMESEQNEIAGESPLERIASETTPVDYVNWKDFAHSCSRTWEEVEWIGRRVYLNDDEGKARFGEAWENIPMTNTPDGHQGDDDYKERLKKAVVWEIWCKSTEKVYWIAEGHDKLLDEKEDPLELEDFFPCPKPLFSCITTDKMIPAPLFRFYQDQANELDDITGRIIHLTKAMKVMGVYAADETSITRLMKEGNDAVLIPITNWQAFMEKGGLGGAVQFMELRDIVQALSQLYASREACKQTIYEITGMSDIIRGASVASESATAQQIKAQFASVRLNDLRDEVARFARDLLRLKAEVMCKKYQPDTLVMESGIQFTPDAQYAQQAIEMLNNEPLRNFSIDIETDQLVQLDEQQERENRVQFLGAAGAFLEKAVQASQVAPDIVPLVMQMMMFGIRGWKVGREMEGVFESTAAQIMQNLQQRQQQPPQPSPEQIKQQAEMQKMQGKAQVDMQLKQMDMQKEAFVQQQENFRNEQDNRTDLQIAGLKEMAPIANNIITGEFNG